MHFLEVVPQPVGQGAEADRGEVVDGEARVALRVLGEQAGEDGSHVRIVEALHERAEAQVAGQLQEPVWEGSEHVGRGAGCGEQRATHRTLRKMREDELVSASVSRTCSNTVQGSASETRMWPKRRATLRSLLVSSRCTVSY